MALPYPTGLVRDRPVSNDVNNRARLLTANIQAPVPSKNRRGWLIWFLSREFKLGAIGLFLFGFGLFELLRQELSILNWQETQGIIIDSQTESLVAKNASPGPQYRVHVRYQYTVDGNGYEGTRITTGEPALFYGGHEAGAFRQRFPPGAPITVLYAPYAHSEATLFAERGSGPWILLGFGTSCLFLAIYLCWTRNRNREPLLPDVDIPIHSI
jgi:hypothetical protein